MRIIKIDKRATANTGFASGGATYNIQRLSLAFAFVSVDRTSSRLPPERKARKRWAQLNGALNK